MIRWPGTIVAYISLIGLILSVAIPTLDNIGNTLRDQYGRVANAIVGKSYSVSHRPKNRIKAYELNNYFQTNSLKVTKGLKIREFKEEKYPENNITGSYKIINRYMKNMEDLGEKIAERLNGED